MCNDGLSDLLPMRLVCDGQGLPSEILQNGVYELTAGKGFQPQAVAEVAKRVGRVVQMLGHVCADDVVIVERASPSVDGDQAAALGPLRSRVVRQGQEVKGAHLNAA